MNSKKIGILCLSLLAYSFQSKAQIVDDLLKFSQSEQGATARMKALGNAQTALGGDISSISGNPAGLGFFNQSDISVSFDYFGDRNKTNYFDGKNTSNFGRVGLNQAGVVFNLPSYRARGGDLQSGWINFNIGIGYAKTQSFNTKLNFSGNNDASSITEFLADEADFGDSFLGDMGYEMGLIDYNKTGTNNYHFPTSGPYVNNQETQLRKKGTQSETNLSFGGNYSNVFYIGASIGFSAFNYDMDRDFWENGGMADAAQIQKESPESEFLDPSSYLNNLLGSDYQLQYTTSQITRGRGVNGKIGMIFRPTPAFRIGVSGTTPTWYHVTNDLLDYGETYFNNHTTGTQIDHLDTKDLDGSFYQEYNFRTPYRLNGGLAYVFGDGLISGDIEYINYKSIHYSYDDDQADEDAINASIKDSYRGTLNYKVGVEYRIAPEFLIRGGYNFNNSPYKDKSYDISSQTISGGLGYRINNVYFDLTYQNLTLSDTYAPYKFNYRDAANPTASFDNTRNNVFLTFGAKF
ncbi:Outer membrane protein transport protein (OMPP1/FadL/TodX) [bacterium A37T11]|nr:Outer membrane protein transport protein (OMPP1/FadL/TodX) [bacterium A37T11]